MSDWTIEDSIELYGIHNWGANFFSVNEKGNVVVDPRKDGNAIDLRELVDDLKRLNLTLPVLIRFSDILAARIKKMNECFAKAIEEYEYGGKYYGVFPIKVNQQKRVVEEILRYGKAFNIGLEAGSKPELHAVLAMMDNPNGLIVCNGYKDESFIRMALIGQKLQRKIIIVIEKPQELELVIRVAKDLEIRPSLGLRVKLYSSGSGRWEKSGGENSKFGLTAAEIMDAVGRCRAEGMLDCIQLLHFHLGSQITNIRRVKDGMKEICRFYKELTLLGCHLNFVDVGGGLGVDYDGTRSTNESSVNYSVQEYANDIVYSLAEFCREEELATPDIITESGRALTAHHSLIVFDVLEATEPPIWEAGMTVGEDDDATIHELRDLIDETTPATMNECWHDAVAYKDQALTKFELGLINLESRAKAERLFWTIARKVHSYTLDKETLPEELEDLRLKLAEKYFCNLSIFQSLPDTWAIDQVFPIMPIHRLNERPLHEITLQDITCDSDGNVDKFIYNGQIDHVLTVPGFKPGEPYIMAAFLVGAYQEILGDLHNLFGDTHTVHVALNEDGSWRYEQIIMGENITSVLSYVQFTADDLLERISKLVGISLGSGRIEPEEAEELMTLYRNGLLDYTYLVHKD